MHSPIAFYHDVERPRDLFPKDDQQSIRYPVDRFSIEDTWKCMEKAVELGLLRYIGVSNFNIKQIQRILKICKIKPSVVQCECHPYLTQTELIKFCQSNDIMFTAYSPFGSLDYITKRGMNIKNVSPLFDKQVINIAKECSVTFNRSISCAQVLLRFHIERNVSVIPKATSKEHLMENLDVMSWNLNDKQINILLGLNKDWRCLTMTKNINHPEYPF